MGYRMVIWPVSAFRVANKAQAKLYAAIKRDGGTQNMIGEMQTRAELYATIGYHEYEALDASIVADRRPAGHAAALESAVALDRSGKRRGRRWKRATSPGAQIFLLVDTEISNAAASDSLGNLAPERQRSRIWRSQRAHCGQWPAI